MGQQSHLRRNADLFGIMSLTKATVQPRVFENWPVQMLVIFRLLPGYHLRPEFKLGASSRNAVKANMALYVILNIYFF